MDLEDFFNRNHHRRKLEHHKHDDDHRHYEGKPQNYNAHSVARGHNQNSDRQYDHHDGPYRHKGHFELLDLSRITQLMLANKKLLILAGGVLLAVVALSAIILLPLLGQALDYVDKDGLKGVIDRVWQGAGGGK